MPVILCGSISLLAKVRELMLSILNLSRGASGALLALVCWKPSITLLRDHPLLRKCFCLLDKSQTSQMLLGVMWAEIQLKALLYSH